MMATDLLLILSSVICAGVGINYLVFAKVHNHRYMTKDCTDRVIYGTYNDFLKAFHRYNWSYDTTWDGSVFDYTNNSQIHASIVKFSGVGMIIRNPIHYRKALKYVKLYIERVKSSECSPDAIIGIPMDNLGHLIIPNDGSRPVYVTREELTKS